LATCKFQNLSPSLSPSTLSLQRRRNHDGGAAVCRMTAQNLEIPAKDGISNHIIITLSLENVSPCSRRVFNYGREDILGDMMHLFAVLNTHMQLYNYVIFLNGIRQVITSSWDKTLKCWDPRGASCQEHTRVGTYTQPAPLLELFSSSNCWMTCCVLSSIEGQVAMEYFDFSEAGQLKKYYPKFLLRIAALPFSRDGRPLAVASSYTYEEGKKASEWTHFIFLLFSLKKEIHDLPCFYMITLFVDSLKNCEPEFLVSTPERLQELLSCGDIETSDVSFLYPKFPSRIAALPFRRDGRLLAVASSYTYEEGKKGVDSWLHELDAILVCSVNEVEVKPKPRILPNPTT
ncbi:hypothetical protein H5410_054976, partial [Solanum commersonii]